MGPGLAPGQPAGQRGRHPAGHEGPVQPDHARPRRGPVRPVRGRAGAGGDPERPVQHRRAETDTAPTSCRRCSRASRAQPAHGAHAGSGGHAEAQPRRAAHAETENRFGVIGGDNAGFPNGRRLGDDVVDIELQVVAGFLKGNKVPLGDGVDRNDKPFLPAFPYLPAPTRASTRTPGTRTEPAHPPVPAGGRKPHTRHGGGALLPRRHSASRQTALNTLPMARHQTSQSCQARRARDRVHRSARRTSTDPIPRRHPGRRTERPPPPTRPLIDDSPGAIRGRAGARRRLRPARRRLPPAHARDRRPPSYARAERSFAARCAAIPAT